MPNLTPYTKFELKAEIEDDRFDELYSEEEAKKLAAEIEETVRAMVKTVVFARHKVRLKELSVVVKKQGWH